MAFSAAVTVSLQQCDKAIAALKASLHQPGPHTRAYTYRLQLLELLHSSGSKVASLDALPTLERDAGLYMDQMALINSEHNKENIKIKSAEESNIKIICEEVIGHKRDLINTPTNDFRKILYFILSPKRSVEISGFIYSYFAGVTFFAFLTGLGFYLLIGGLCFPMFLIGVAFFLDEKLRSSEAAIDRAAEQGIAAAKDAADRARVVETNKYDAKLAAARNDLAKRLTDLSRQIAERQKQHVHLAKEIKGTIDDWSTRAERASKEKTKPARLFRLKLGEISV